MERESEPLQRVPQAWRDLSALPERVLEQRTNQPFRSHEQRMCAERRGYERLS